MVLYLTEFTKMGFMTIWKGLFYSMWMCPELLAQEELAESISRIVHCFDKKETIVLYITCSFRTLATEWFSIDQYNVDKFQMVYPLWFLFKTPVIYCK